MNQCYFNGDFYQAAADTSPGDSPSSAPGSWRKIQIPVEFRWILLQLTYAHLLELDGQIEKAAATRTKALDSERIGLTDTLRREAQAEIRRLGRPAVQTPYNLNLNGLTGWPNARVDR